MFLIVVFVKVQCITMATECVLEKGDTYAVAFARVSNWARESNCSSKKNFA